MTSLLQQKAEMLKELLRRKKLPINQYVPDNTPGHDQLSFHKSLAPIKIVFGGNRSGKSVITAAEVAWAALGTHPYIKYEGPQKIWVLSNEYRTLTEGIWRHLRPDAKDQPSPGMGFLPANRISYFGDKVQGFDIRKEIHVKFGYPDEEGKYLQSIINFISAEGNESARRKVQAAAVDLIVIDEEIEYSIVAELLARLFDTGGRLLISATLVRGEEWLLDLEDRAENGDPDVFVTILNTKANKYLDEKQIAVADKFYTDEEKQIRFFGKSTRNTNLVYKDFGIQNIINPFPIPETWDIIYALDSGHRVFGGLFLAYDNEKDLLYVVDEMYIKMAQLHEVAAFIQNNKYYRYKKKIGLIDPAATRKLETGEPSVQDQLITRYNIVAIPAFNAVDAGINAVRDLIRVCPILNIPRLRVFNSCQEFLKERKGYQIGKDRSSLKTHESRDEPIRRKNHLMDCLRYGVMYLYPRYQDNIKMSSFQKGILKKQAKYIHPFLGSEF